MPQIIPLFKRTASKTEPTVQDNKKEQFFIFKFGAKAFAVPAVDVTEVSNVCAVVPQNGKADYLEGVMNIRGSIVPLVNIRKRINMTTAYNITNDSKIILYAVKPNFYVGMVVDHIEFSLQEGILEPIHSAAANEKVFGYAKINGEQYPVFLIDTWIEPSEFEFMQKEIAKL